MTGLIGVVAAVGALWTATGYRREPSVKLQGAMDNAAGLWVFACYAAAGFAPFSKMLT